MLIELLDLGIKANVDSKFRAFISKHFGKLIVINKSHKKNNDSYFYLQARSLKL